MIATALGVIRLNRDEFWRLSLSEWLLVQHGFFMQKELESRQSWEQARLISYFAVKPHVKRNTMNAVDSLFKFSWEKNNNAADVIFSKDEMTEIIKKYGRFYDEKTDKFVN